MERSVAESSRSVAKAYEFISSISNTLEMGEFSCVHGMKICGR